MAENDFERVLAESFTNAVNNTNDIPISTSEANNVNDIFVGNEVQTECIICYEENIQCINCFQCTAIYCKICLTKIASDSNKCICGIDIRQNYSQLKQYNQNLIKKAILNKKKIEKTKRDKAQRDKAQRDKAQLNKVQLDQNMRNNKNTNNRNANSNKNANSNSTIIDTNYINNFILNDNDNDNITEYIYNSTDTNLNLKLDFLKELTDNKIYNIDFKSFRNEIGNTIPNFKYKWDYIAKTLTFYTVPDNNKDLKNIVFNYTILQAESQAELYIWILEILKLPFPEFKKNWNKIATIMPTITTSNKTVLVNKIVELCKI